MLDYILNQLEESFSEFWINYQVIANHLKSWLAQVHQNWRQEIFKMETFFFKNDCKQHESFRVTSILVRLRVVFDHGLKSRQEVLVEVREILFFFDVSLDKRENILSEGLHGLDSVIRTSLSDCLANLFRIILVDHNQVVEDDTQVAKILSAHTNCNSLVYFDYVNELLDCVGLHQKVHVLVGLL